MIYAEHNLGAEHFGTRTGAVLHFIGSQALTYFSEKVTAKESNYQKP